MVQLAWVARDFLCAVSGLVKPSLGRREKLAEKAGRRKIYCPVPPPSRRGTDLKTL